MSCSNVGKACDRLIISRSVTYNSGVLTINLPAGSYANGEKYCLLLNQPIPALTIIGAPVVITIGDSAVTYPLLNCDCTRVSVCQLSYRKRYATRVHTDIQGGVFKLLGKANCCHCNQNNAPAALPIA